MRARRRRRSDRGDARRRLMSSTWRRERDVLLPLPQLRGAGVRGLASAASGELFLLSNTSPLAPFGGEEVRDRPCLLPRVQGRRNQPHRFHAIRTVRYAEGKNPAPPAV